MNAWLPNFLLKTGIKNYLLLINVFVSFCPRCLSPSTECHPFRSCQQQICNNCLHITTVKPLSKFSHHNAEKESKQQWCIRRSARGEIYLHCLGPSLNYTIIMPSTPSPNSLHSICTFLDNICQYITNQQRIQIPDQAQTDCTSMSAGQCSSVLCGLLQVYDRCYQSPVVLFGNWMILHMWNAYNSKPHTMTQQPGSEILVV